MKAASILLVFLIFSVLSLVFKRSKNRIYIQKSARIETGYRHDGKVEFFFLNQKKKNGMFIPRVTIDMNNTTGLCEYINSIQSIRGLCSSTVVFQFFSMLDYALLCSIYCLPHVVRVQCTILMSF